MPPYSHYDDGQYDAVYSTSRRPALDNDAPSQSRLGLSPGYDQRPQASPFSPHSPWISALPSKQLSSSSTLEISQSYDEEQQEESLPPRSTSHSRSVWRNILPDSLPCRLYILVVVIQTLVDLVIEGVLVLKFHHAAKINTTLNESSARRLPIYFIIFCFAHVFQFILALDAVWMRNTLQFLFLTAFNFIILIYAIVQIFEIREVPQDGFAEMTGILSIPLKVLTSLTPCVIAIAELAYLFLGWSIWREFGWKVYKLLGADRQVKRMYMHYQILQCIMKFDVFFWGGFSIQLIWMVLQPTNVEYYVTVAALPASVVVLVAGHLGARYEHKPLMYAFMLSCVGASGYFAFKLFRVIQQRHAENIEPVFKTLSAFAALAILFLVATFTWSCIVLGNFGAGLKYHMSKHKQHSGQSHRRRRKQQSDGDNHLFEMSKNAKRMSID